MSATNIEQTLATIRRMHVRRRIDQIKFICGVRDDGVDITVFNGWKAYHPQFMWFDV